MGNGFGHVLSNGYNLYYHPEVTPHPLEPATFDPEFGFENGRKERKMIATEEEMKSAKLPLKDRDYCAHLLLKYRGCRKEHWPFAVKCAHEKHEYLNCQYEDYLIRMKEYEREKRLRVLSQKNPEIASHKITAE